MQRAVMRGGSVILVALGLTVVHAAQGQVASPSPVLEAVAAKERAIDSGREEDWQTALRLFRLAHQTQPSAETAYEMGVAASAVGQDDLAFEAYYEALELGLTEVAHEKATNFLSVFRPRLAWVHLRCAAGSRVLIRGIERGHTPLARPVAALPGVAQVECHPASGTALLREVTLVAGEEQLVVLEASKEQVSASAELPRMDQSPTARRRASDAEHPGFGRALSRDSLLSTDTAAPIVDRAAQSPTNASSRARVTSESMRTAPQVSHRLGWLLVGPGATLFVWSGYLALFAASQIGEGRHALLNVCAMQAGGPDTCRYAKAGQQAQAQGHSDSIATWKAVRTVSLAGAGLGAVASVVGAGMIAGLVGGTGPGRQSAQLVVSQTGVALELRATFE